MWRPSHLATACGLAALLLTSGCRNQNVAIPNPLTTADRVPPPGLKTVPGAAPPYAAQPYAGTTAPPFGAGPTTFAPAPAPPAGGFAPAAPGGFAPAPAAPFSQPTTIPPGQAAPVYAPPTGGASPAPFGGGSASRPMDRSRQLAGDTISVQPDAGSLRFGGASADPGPNRGPAPQTALAASNQPRRATANSWIANSGPVRSRTDSGSRVRVPGAASEPVSIAALDRGVPVAPLERAPTGARAGEPAPLRVASPPSSTGWR